MKNEEASRINAAAKEYAADVPKEQKEIWEEAYRDGRRAEYYYQQSDESPSSDPAEIELPFMDAREWSDADKAKLVEETMRLSAAPIMNTMAMLGINNLMRCEVVNHATGDEYIFSFQRKETKPDPAEVLVKAIPADVARKILLVRDALVKRDMEGAYHHLYSIASPKFDHYEPWKELEEIAKNEQLKQQ